MSELIWLAFQTCCVEFCQIMEYEKGLYTFQLQRKSRQKSKEFRDKGKVTLKRLFYKVQMQNIRVIFKILDSNISATLCFFQDKLKYQLYCEFLPPPNKKRQNFLEKRPEGYQAFTKKNLLEFVDVHVTNLKNLTTTTTTRLLSLRPLRFTPGKEEEQMQEQQHEDLLDLWVSPRVKAGIKSTRFKTWSSF